jgi:dipeptidyl aminopeptidase/acylaminoacyl peptidase
LAFNQAARLGKTTERIDQMPPPQVVPYGSWKSPITSDRIVSGTIGLEQVVLNRADVYWIEARPSEAGRNVIVRRTPDGRMADMTPPPFNARTRVHEYGGGAFTVQDGIVYFAHFADQRLYAVVAGEQPRPITPEGSLRYADAVVDRRGRIICVCEDHTVAGKEPRNTVASIPLDGHGAAQTLVSGHDFYSNPRLGPDGRKLAWLAWNHPNMPWDGTELWVGELGPDGALGRSERVAGGTAESIFQPEWSPDGVLHFISDRTGWWNLYRLEGATAEPLCPLAAEFGRPQWVFGISTYAFEPSGGIICTYFEKGFSRLARLDPRTRQLEPLETPYSEMSSAVSVQVAGNRLVFTAGSPTEATAVVQLDLTTRQTEVLRRSDDTAIDPGYLSVPQAVEFPTESGRTAHAFYYPPQNDDFTAPAGERPPLIVRSHGGPTGATNAILRLEYQFWTSRGFALLDVNYGGSTGYGRAYRQRLNGQWGIVDVDDCVNGARFLVERGLADPRRLAIRGGSAGGYTTLCALTFRDQFLAGASYYGVSDLEALAQDTHKFESRYLDSLVGPYPERRDLYRERSPIHFTDRLACPVILFQGLEDKVVPPNQAELMVEALRRKGLPVAYVPFEGEQHGFRRAENIKRALDGELYFYSRVFGFALAEPVPPVAINNLPS